MFFKSLVIKSNFIFKYKVVELKKKTLSFQALGMQGKMAK